MIDAHPGVAIFPETHMFAVLDFVGALQRFSDPWQYILFLNEVWANLSGYSDPAASVWVNHAIQQPLYTGPSKPLLLDMGWAYAGVRKARVWGEKTPGHALWLPDICNLFPEAKIIITVRDPRDVLVSYCERWNAGRFETSFLMKSVANLRYHLDRLLHSPVFPAEQILWIRYEDLVADPEREMRGICKFMALEFNSRMLSFFECHQDVEQETPDGIHHRLLSRPVSRERVGTFRDAFSWEQLRLIEELLANQMAALEYARETSPVAFSLREKAMQQRAQRRYEQIASGKIRNQQRLRMKRKIWLYRNFTGLLACFPATRLAVSSEDWRGRAQEMTFQRSAARAGLE